MGDIRSRLVTEIPRLRRYARPLTSDFTAADDLVQDCLVRALSKSHLWQEGSDLRAWLFTILHNQYVNDVRPTGSEKRSRGTPLHSSSPPQISQTGIQRSYTPGPCITITTRRLRGSLTPSAVGTARSSFPRPAVVISSGATPSAISEARTAAARCSDRR
jgi:Sigma-70 region 2